MQATATLSPNAAMIRAQGTLLQARPKLPILALPTKQVETEVESDDMETLWVEAAKLDARMLVATFDPYTSPWVRSVFDPSHRTTVPVDTGRVPASARGRDYTPMPFQDPCQGLYQRTKNAVSMATEDHKHDMPLHTKGVMLADADGWTLFFEAETIRWAKRNKAPAQDALFVFKKTNSAHQTVLLHASVAQRMAQIQPLLAALIGRALPFAPTFVPIPK